MERNVTLAARDGVALEGMVDVAGKDWVVLLHPHPLYGGTMDNNIMYSLQEACVRADMSTLRFNFRGVGRSGGTHGEGMREVDDVGGALDYAASHHPSRIFVVGYSFGAHVGARAVVGEERVSAIGCVSPPVDMYDFSCLYDDTRPVLLVAGDRDFVCSLEKLNELFSEISEPKLLHIVPGADHFWWGFEADVARYTLEFFRDL